MSQTHRILVAMGADNRQELQELLVALGYAVVDSTDYAGEALELTRRLTPDLVVMDTLLMGEPGWQEACRVIQDDLGLPVILISDAPDRLDELKKAPAYGVVLNPFRPAQVQASVESALVKRESEQDRVRQREGLSEIFHAFFDMANSAMLALSPDLRILLANARAAEFFGQTAEELAGRKFCSFVAAEDCARLEQALAEAERGEKWTGECVGLASDGGSFPMELTASHLHQAGEDAFCVVARSLAEHREMQDVIDRGLARTQELQITVRTMMETAQDMRQDSKEELTRQIRTELFPALDRITIEKTQKSRKRLTEEIKTQVMDITKGSTHMLDQLSATELEVCKRIAAGDATKDIAEAMDLAFETIQTHRKNIRDKLGLKGRKISLYSFLKTQKGLD